MWLQLEFVVAIYLVLYCSLALGHITYVPRSTCAWSTFKIHTTNMHVGSIYNERWHNFRLSGPVIKVETLENHIGVRV